MFFAASAAPPEVRLPLHLVQQRPSKTWSNSSQSGFRHTTSRHRMGSAFGFIGTPPPRPSAQLRSSGTLMSSDQQSGQQVPVFSFVTNLNGGTHSIGSQF